MKTAGPEEIIFLTKFRKLVYDSYFLSNGARSSKTILLTQDDPDLVLSGDLSASERQERDTLSMLFRQRYAPASVSNLCWNDICAIATTLHEIDIRDKTLTAKLRAKTKSRFTGYDYITDGQSTYVSGLTPVTSDKQIISIASAGTGESEQALEYHNLK